MLLLPTELRPSPIDGIGCFARHPISRGTPIWRFQPGFDQILDEAFASARCNARFLATYAQQCPETGFWVLCCDDARFINHADNPNMGQVAPLFDPRFTHDALRDIAAGEEITCDYRIGDAQPFQGFEAAA